MIPDIIAQSAGRFDQRFFLTALVPTAVFAPAIALIVLKSTGSLTTVVDWYLSQTAVLQILAWLGGAAVVWFLATLLASQWNSVVRLYEGYPLVHGYASVNRVLGRLGVKQSFMGRPVGIAAHQRGFDKLKKLDRLALESPPSVASEYELEPVVQLYDNYPPTIDRVMPTSLGNILRAAEDYAADRYGFDTIYLWTRLSIVLPSDYLVDVERAIVTYQTPLMVSFGSALLAISSILLLTTSIGVGIFLVIFLGSFAASWIAYRLSFQAAREYGDLLRSAVDLFRTDLLERWWPELLAIEDDRSRLDTLREFVLSGKRPGEVEETPTREATEDSPTIAPRVPLVVAKDEADSQPLADADGADSTLRLPKFAFRLSAVAAIAILGLACVGVYSLGKPVYALAAREDITAFSDLTGKVEVVPFTRGSVGDDALASAGEADSVKTTLVDDAQALRRIAKGEVLRRADVGPKGVPTRSTGVVVEISQDAGQVAALDLHPGDEVFLQGTLGGGAASACQTNTGSPPGPYPRGTVLAVVRSRSADTVNVVVQVDSADTSRRCMGDLSRAEVIRPPTSSTTAPQGP